MALNWSQLDDSDFAQAVMREARLSLDETKDWRKETREDFDFYAGHQWDEKDAEDLKKQSRPTVVFNRSAPTIDVVTGVERSNRQRVQYLPRTIGQTPDQVDDAGVSEMFTETARWSDEECNGVFEESDAFKDTTICGMGWTETYVDFTEDPEGAILRERLPPLDMIWDPTSRRQNLRDSRWRGRIKLVHRDDLPALFPGKDVPTSETSEPFQGFFLNWRGEEEGPDAQLIQRYRDYVPIVQIQWFELQDAYWIKNPQTGQLTEIPPDKMATIPPEYASMVAQTQKKVYWQGIVGGTAMLERKPLHQGPDGKACPGFTFECITGKRDERRFQRFGLMRQMKDPQRWANKFLSTLMHVMSSTAKGGLLAEKSAFDNPSKAEKDWGNPQAIIWLNDGALSGGQGQKPRIEQRLPTPLPPAVDKLLEFAVMSIRDTTGVNLELLGLRGRFQSGMVEDSRVRQALMVLGELFDSLRLYRLQHGKVMLHLMNVYIPDGRMVRVTGQNKYIQFRHVAAQYGHDVVIDEAPATPSQKQEVWESMMQVLPAMMKAGVPVPPDVIDYSPFPQSVINRIKAFWQSNAPAQEKAKALEDAQLEADIQLTQAGAVLKNAQAAASMQRAETDANLAQTEAYRAISEFIADTARVQIEAVEAAKPDPKPSE